MYQGMASRAAKQQRIEDQRRQQQRADAQRTQEAAPPKMIHDVNGINSPLARVGPLPDDWPDCQERPLR